MFRFAFFLTGIRLVGSLVNQDLRIFPITIMILMILIVFIIVIPPVFLFHGFEALAEEDASQPDAELEKEDRRDGHH